ncbi:MAG: hypothetical protein L3K10_04460 [Thermoplasmata archaeon]|nr:hypothetical protein [Thermoplasmata archaeon]
MGSQEGKIYADPAPFADVSLPHVGTLYLVVALLVVIGGSLGILAGYFIKKGASDARRRLVSTLLLLTVIIALLGPLLLVVEQPAAICSDSHPGSSTPLAGPPTNDTGGMSIPCSWDIVTPRVGGSGYGFDSGITPGPQSSFFGTDNVSGQHHTWGPAMGWYLALASSAILGGGAVTFYRSRAGRPEGTAGGASSKKYSTGNRS